MSQLVQLETLSLDHNRFSHFPEVIYRMDRLVRLSLRHNSIFKIPASIRFIPDSLAVLDLSANALTSLPLTMCYLTNLLEIHLRANPLKDPPISASSLEVLSSRYIETGISHLAKSKPESRLMAHSFYLSVYTSLFKVSISTLPLFVHPYFFSASSLPPSVLSLSCLFPFSPAFIV